MKYLIAFDIDGTILDDKSELSDTTKEYIKKFQDEGHIVSLITGRPFRTSRYIYDELKLNSPIGNYSGSSVHNPKDEEFPAKNYFMQPTAVNDILRTYGEHILNGYCEVEDKVYLFYEQEELIRWLRIPNGELVIGDAPIKENISGAVLYVAVDKAQEIEDFAKTYPNLGCRYWRSLKAENYSVIEIYTTLSSKANAMEQIRNYHNIPIENTIAVGDGVNDIDMLEYAHYSAYMHGAPERVQLAGKFEAQSNNENGAVLFVESVINGTIKESK